MAAEHCYSIVNQILQWLHSFQGLFCDFILFRVKSCSGLSLVLTFSLACVCLLYVKEVMKKHIERLILKSLLKEEILLVSMMMDCGIKFNAENFYCHFSRAIYCSYYQWQCMEHSFAGWQQSEGLSPKMAEFSFLSVNTVELASLRTSSRAKNH